MADEDNKSVPPDGMPELIEALKYVYNVADSLHAYAGLAVSDGPLCSTDMRDTQTGEVDSIPNITMVLSLAKQMVDALVLMRTAIHAMGIDGDGNVNTPADMTNVVMMAPVRYGQADRFFTMEEDDGGDRGPDAA